MYNPRINQFVDINLIDKFMTASKDTLTTYTDMMVYLNRDALKHEISILIDSDLDTLVECNLYNYNPLQIGALLFNDIPEKADITNDLLTKFNSIHMNKQKYISHLLTDNAKMPHSFNKLFSYNNNYTEFLIRLWSVDNKHNIYYVTDQKYNVNNIIRTHNGGSIGYRRIKINKILKIINQLNLSLIDLYHILTKLSIDHNMNIYNGYLYINNYFTH
jgi:hypothetical protein